MDRFTLFRTLRKTWGSFGAKRWFRVHLLGVYEAKKFLRIELQWCGAIGWGENFNKLVVFGFGFCMIDPLVWPSM